MGKFLFFGFLLFSFNLISQTIPNNSTLVLKDIMKGDDFIGHSPENIRWTVDGTAILFEWNPENNPGNFDYAYTINSKDKNILKVENADRMEFDRLQNSFSTNYYAIEGALIAYDKKSKQQKIVYHTSSPIRNVQRTNYEHFIYFQQGSNLFCYNSLKGTIVQTTNFQSSEDSKNKVDSTNLMKQQTELFEFIQDKNARKEWKLKQDKNLFSLPTKIFIGKESLENIQISPDAAYISFRLSTYPNSKQTQVENHISADGYTYSSSAREKVSDIDAFHQLGIYSLQNDTVVFIDFSKLSDIRKKAAYLKDEKPYEKDRNIIMHSLKFSKHSAFAVCDIRSYDNKDRWIVIIDLKNGTFKEIDKQHDDAWIGGPGISSWNMAEGTLGWLKDNETVYFQSEASGYSHLYFYKLKTGKKEQITSGKWEVHEVQLSNDGTKMYITANRSHPGNRDFLRYDIMAKKIVPILIRDGYHEVSLSPDEKTLAVRYSYKNKPWELYTAPNISSTQLTQITYSTSKEFKNYTWKEPEVITFKGSDGIDVYARLYNPENAKNKAAVIFVHGAGYLQNAHNYWSTYHREYMFHNLLADNGFTVLDIDYRASEGYGRDYRTAIYRHMGGQDLQDNLSGKEYLVEQLGIDSNRVGIYGGSYGGFITLMAMLTTPGEFACGAALRSVTDWAHYNHEYTSNILNYPGTDPEAYKKSSPIYYANQLQGKLLMLHGMVDDNVQFQDVVRLSQRFIELGKENWELASYPIEAHGFKESYSWTDEYRRIYELFYTELILKHTK